MSHEKHNKGQKRSAAARPTRGGAVLAALLQRGDGLAWPRCIVAPSAPRLHCTALPAMTCNDATTSRGPDEKARTEFALSGSRCPAGPGNRLALILGVRHQARP